MMCAGMTKRQSEMKVLYDYQAFNMQRVGGISRYFSLLINELPQLGIQTQLPIIGSENLYIKDKGLLGSRFKRLFKKNRRLSKLLLPVLSHDLFHPTYYHPYVLKYRQKKHPMVITVHDMIHELFSQYFPDAATVKEQKLAVCQNAERLIAISENTKRDIIELWGIDESKIDVVYHGLMWAEDLQPKAPRLPFAGDYVLYVGDRWAKYKNFEEFIRGTAPVLHRYGLHLICTGYGFAPHERALLHSYGIDNITYSVMADERMLLGLYQNAACFVFPSQYEGFGIPILEAFKARCPVLLSRASCFPEIAADAAEYFEVGSPESLTASLTTILDSSDKRETMRQLGSERLRLFPASRMIAETKQAYEHAIAF